MRITSRFDGAETGGTIVEVEAYRQDDPASHCYRGPSRRNASMYLEGGHLYVYLIYGIHYCVNVVCGESGYGEAVLLRGILPDVGLDLVRRRRGVLDDRTLANGPGKLTQALGIGPSHDGLDILGPDSPIVVGEGPSTPRPSQIEVTPRIGISKGTDLLWRWHWRRASGGQTGRN